jgi:hypothetical protein
MKDVQVKLNPEVPWQKAALNKKMIVFSRASLSKFKEETIKVLHLEHSLVWC